jgi:predicted transcriptional regulator
MSNSKALSWAPKALLWERILPEFLDATASCFWNSKGEPENQVQSRGNIMWWFKRQSGSAGSEAPALERLGSLESELMEQIWPLEEVSVRDLHSKLAPRLAYTTIMTTLDRLYKKGLLCRRKAGKAYVYFPALSEKEYQGRLTEHFIGLALNGGKSGQAVLSSFVDAVTEADEEMLDRLDLLVKAKQRILRRTESQR